MQLARLFVKLKAAAAISWMLFGLTPSLSMPDLRIGWGKKNHKNKMKRNLCALGSRNMGSEQGRGARWGNMTVQLSGVERLVWPVPHMYTVGAIQAL